MSDKKQSRVKPKKWAIICCPVSGKKVGQALMENEFIPRMKQLNIPVELLLTNKAGHATQLAKEKGSEECGLVIVGGDGTVHEVMDGLVEADKLDKVCLAILSQGTMNAYYHSACLPDVKKLPDLINSNSFRSQPLMKVKDDSGKIDTLCFEAIYIGVAYKPAQGAQEFRHSFLGPMFGIMYYLIKSCAFPDQATVSGKLTLYPKADGSNKNPKPIIVEDDFYWIIICQRNPYNGCLVEDDLWVSYITRKNFPGFSRMFESFKPPSEFFSGVANLMENHVSVSKVDFVKSSGQIGVCLDGDPMLCGNRLEAVHMKHMWNIIAEKNFPTKISDEMTYVREETECAKEWLRLHPVPKNVYKPPKKVEVKTKGTNSGIASLILAGVVVVTGVFVYMNKDELNLDKGFDGFVQSLKGIFKF